jgi:hypothetical protein
MEPSLFPTVLKLSRESQVIKVLITGLMDFWVSNSFCEYQQQHDPGPNPGIPDELNTFYVPFPSHNLPPYVSFRNFKRKEWDFSVSYLLKQI